MYTFYVNRACTPYVIRACTPFMWTVHAHLLCEPCMYTLCEPCTYTFYVNRACTPLMWTVHAHLLCEPCMYTLCDRISRVGQNHIYTVYIRYFRRGNHQIYGHIRCIYTVLANPTYIWWNFCMQHKIPCIHQEEESLEEEEFLHKIPVYTVYMVLANPKHSILMYTTQSLLFNSFTHRAPPTSKHNCTPLNTPF